MFGVSRLKRYWAEWRWARRRRAFNRVPGFVVPADVWIAPTAQLQASPDGFGYGGRLRLSTGARISDGAILAPYGGSIELGENVFIGPYCVIYGHGGLVIGRHTMIAAHTVIIPSNHRFDDPHRPIGQQGETSLGITIGQDVWIGCGVRILDGVEIGDGCVIGAGAVVTGSIPPGTVAVGVPARVIKSRGTGHTDPIELSASTQLP
ncbi:MAG TPA: acyltransferase [Gemmataceae bacterium]|nr:acyltransferase [Gemmataceae bacterium]